LGFSFWMISTISRIELQLSHAGYVKGIAFEFKIRDAEAMKDFLPSVSSTVTLRAELIVYCILSA
jgi:hypothetical protein